MRAWLLLLAVLATFQPFVQVASTEDITSRFFNAISPQQQQQQFLTPHSTQQSDYANNEIEKLTNNLAEKSKTQHATTTSIKSFDTSLSATATTTALSLTSPPRTLTTIANEQVSKSVAPELRYKSSVSSDISVESAKNIKDQEIINTHSDIENTSDIIIEIKNIAVNEDEDEEKELLTEQEKEAEAEQAKELEVRKIQKHYEQKVQHQRQMQAQLQQNKSVQEYENSSKQANTQASVDSRTKEQKADAEAVQSSDGENISENSSENSSEQVTNKMAVETSELTSANANANAMLQQQQPTMQHRPQEHVQHQHQHQHHHHHHHHHQQQHAHEEHQQHEQKHTKHRTNVTASSATTSLTTTTTSSPSTTTTTTTMSSTTSASVSSAHRTDTSTTQQSDASKYESVALSIATDATDATEVATQSLAQTNTELEPELELELESESEPATYSNKELISEKAKPDPSTLVEIENSLLSLFNMKRPPKIDRSKIIIPEAMKKLYAQIMGHELDSVNIPRPGLLTKSANTVRSFTHQESKIDDRFPHHHRFRLYFDVKSIPTDEKLKAAELQLTRDAIDHAALNPRLANRTRYQVLVYDIIRVGIRGKREPSYLLLDNKMVRLNSTDTLSLDVQPAVERWLGAPKKNYGLLIEVRTTRSLKPAPHRHVRLRRSPDETHERWQHKQPLLFTYTDDGRHKSRSIRDVSSRSKRAGHHRRTHRRKNNEEICRRHSLYVDFADVGWSDWIVAPPGYDAFYCHGKCPFPLAEHLNSTNHAVVQTLVNNINPGKVPKACCVPTQLEGISMLYLNDQSTVVLKNYQDMTVVGCGCR